MANEKTLTVGEQIWEEIKNKDIFMFGLLGKKVQEFVQPNAIEPNKCYLTYHPTAVIPALEEAVGKNYTVSTSGKYLIVERAKVDVG